MVNAIEFMVIPLSVVALKVFILVFPQSGNSPVCKGLVRRKFRYTWISCCHSIYTAILETMVSFLQVTYAHAAPQSSAAGYGSHGYGLVLVDVLTEGADFAEKFWVFTFRDGTYY